MVQPTTPLASTLDGSELIDAPPATVETPKRGRFIGSLRAQAARGTVINAGFTVAVGVIGVVRGFVLAALLTRSDYGLWGILVFSLSTLLWLKQIGIGDRFVAQDEPDQRLAFQKAFTIELGLTIACALVMAVALPLVALLYGLPKLVAPGLVCVLALLISTLQAPVWIHYRQMNFARQRTIQAVDPVVNLCVSIALAAEGAGYWAFAGGLIAGVTATSLAAMIGSPVRLALRYQRGTLRDYVSFSTPLLVAGASTLIMVWAAVIAAQLDLGLAAVGVITLASTITSFTDRVDEVVTGALYPAICAVKDRTALLHESLVKSNRLALMWAMPFGVALTLFSPDLVRFALGERWRLAVPVLQVYGVTAALNHIGFNWTAYFRARGVTRPIAVASLASTAVFLLAGIPLLLAFSLRGFAAGMALQALAHLAVRSWYLRRMFTGFRFLSHAARTLTPTVPAAALVLALRLLETGGRTLPLALGELALYVAVTAALTWRTECGLLREAAGLVRPGAAAPA